MFAFTSGDCEPTLSSSKLCSKGSAALFAVEGHGRATVLRDGPLLKYLSRNLRLVRNLWTP